MANTCNCCGCVMADGVTSIASGSGSSGDPFSVEVIDPMFSSERYSVRRQRSSNQSIPNNILTEVDFTTAAGGSFDRGTFFAPPTSFVVPSTGIYIFGTTIGFADNATGTRYIEIVKNDVTVLTAMEGNSHPGAAFYLTCSSSAPFNQTDIIKVRVLQSSGGNLDILTNAEQSPVFWAVYMGRFLS